MLSRAELDQISSSPRPLLAHFREGTPVAWTGRTWQPAGTPCTVLGNSEPVPSGCEEKAPLLPFAPYKGPILRHPEVPGKSTAATVCFGILCLAEPRPHPTAAP